MFIFRALLFIFILLLPAITMAGNAEKSSPWPDCPPERLNNENKGCPPESQTVWMHCPKFWPQDKQIPLAYTRLLSNLSSDWEPDYIRHTLDAFHDEKFIIECRYGKEIRKPFFKYSEQVLYMFVPSPIVQYGRHHTPSGVQEGVRLFRDKVTQVRIVFPETLSYDTELFGLKLRMTRDQVLAWANQNGYEWAESEPDCLIGLYRRDHRMEVTFHPKTGLTHEITSFTNPPVDYNFANGPTMQAMADRFGPSHTTTMDYNQVGFIPHWYGRPVGITKNLAMIFFPGVPNTSLQVSTLPVKYKTGYDPRQDNFNKPIIYSWISEDKKVNLDVITSRTVYFDPSVSLREYEQ